jgi:uncharacterized membrane protein
MLDSNRKAIPAKLVLLLAVLALAVALRTVALGREGLWMDEIYSVTFAGLPFIDAIVAIFRFDVHPPLYYLQLHAWSELGHGDRWLTLNSVAWSIGTLLAVWAGSTRRFGQRAGLLALCCCAAMGSEIYFADELRMYAMLGCLTVLSWVCADRVLRDYRFRTGLPMLLLLILLSMVHSFSVCAISCVLLYVFPWGEAQRLRQLLPTWLGFVAVAGAALLPWLANAHMRTVSHPEAPSWPTLEHTVGGWLLGYGTAALPPWSVPLAAGVVAAGLLSMLLVARSLTRIVCCFILWPLVFGAVVCVLVRPIWLVDRTFAFCAPFLAVAMGTVLAKALERASAANAHALRYGGFAIVGAGLAALGWVGYAQAVTPRKMQYREVAEYLRQHVLPDELVYAPHLPTYWGIARYLIGPDWGNALSVQDPVNPDLSDKWPLIYARLGTARLKLLHLVPQTRQVDGFRAPLIIGWTPFTALQTTSSYWVIGMTGINLAELRLCPGAQLESIPFGRQIDSIAYTGLIAYHVHCSVGAREINGL